MSQASHKVGFRSRLLSILGLAMLMAMPLAGCQSATGSSTTDTSAYGDDIVSLCDKPSTTPNGSALPADTKFIALQLGNRQMDVEVNQNIPSSRFANTKAEVGGVICSIQVKQNITGDAYRALASGDVYTDVCIRVVYVADVYVVDPKTRQTVYYTHLRGGEPAGCPSRINDVNEQHEVDGSPISAQSIAGTALNAPGAVGAASGSGSGAQSTAPSADASAGSVNPQAIKTFQDSGKVNAVAFSPDGNFVAAGNADNTIQLWSVRYGNQVNVLKGHTDQIVSLAYSPDSTRLASASRDKTVIVWDVRAATKLFTLSGHTMYVSSVAFSPDGNLIGTASGDKTVRLWDAKTGKSSGSPLSAPDQVLSIAFSPDSKTIASAGVDKAIRLWDTKTGKPIGNPFVGHTSYITALAFSPDGTLIVSSSADKTIRLWDVKTGTTKTTLQGQTDVIMSVAFSPNGAEIASSSVDKSIWLWDVKTSQKIISLDGHTDFVSSLAFSPDSTSLASGSGDKTVKLWKVG